MTALPRCAALLGPTASGKTAMAVALRRAGLPIEVVGCDALQLYRRLQAGTAKATPAERAAAPHHLVDCLPPEERAHAGLYLRLAEAAVGEIAGRDGWPLLVGGTGLYHRSFVRGLAAIPEIDPAVRVALQLGWEEQGARAMHDRLRAVDPACAEVTPAANRQRVLRALEVYEGTGRALSDWHAEHRQRPDRVRCFTVTLEPEPAWHRARVERRAAAMAGPLLAEVEVLLAEGLCPEAPAMQALGYRDAARVVTGQAPAEGFAERLVVAHRRYAKRQRTWLRASEADLRLPLPDDRAVDKLAAAIEAFFSRPGSGPRSPREKRGCEARPAGGRDV